MQDLTPEAQRRLRAIAERHGVGLDAALAVLRALVAGQGAMAQFDHPELGGMGQWTQGGMTMVGDMFNQGLRARVDALCTELAALLRAEPPPAAGPSQSQAQSQSRSGSASGVSLFIPGAGSSAAAWWPADLGRPASVGAQNDLRYAVFPAAQRLAIERGGQVTVYATGDHRSPAPRAAGRGPVPDLHEPARTGARGRPAGGRGRRAAVGTGRDGRSARAARRTRDGAAGRRAAVAGRRAALRLGRPVLGRRLATLERLAELHRKGILTEQEFTAKKAELLSRI